MLIQSLDHLVLTVRDRQKTVDFYTQLLGMELREFAPGREALHFGLQKINLHVAERPVDPNVRHATPGSADLCFLLGVPLDSLLPRLQHLVITGPVTRKGAQGDLRSIYLYDPDENLIELSELVPGSNYPAAEGNLEFHARYQQRLRSVLGDRPVCLVLSQDIVLTHKGLRERKDRNCPEFHRVKGRAHKFFASVLEGQAEAGFDVARILDEGARLELEGLHAAVHPWWRALTAEEQARCGILITVPHQARARMLAVQYFQRLTGRVTGLGALHEDGLVVVEQDFDEDNARQQLARHYLDQEAAEHIFGDRFRLQFDVLSDTAETHLERLLPDRK